MCQIVIYKKKYTAINKIRGSKSTSKKLDAKKMGTAYKLSTSFSCSVALCCFFMRQRKKYTVDIFFIIKKFAPY